MEIPAFAGMTKKGRGDDESVAGTTCSCRQGEASPSPLSIRIGEGRACFPECFSEEGVACEPVPDFEDVPVGEFYQDAVPFQIQRSFPYDAAAGEGVEHGFALPCHEL